MLENSESQAALQEAEELKKPGVGKVFKTIDELREDLLSDDDGSVD